MYYGLRLSAIALVTALPGATLAQEMVPITIAASHPTAVPWVGALQTYVVQPANARLEAMGSNYRIEWTEAFGGSLYNFQETLEAVETGLTDLGWVGALWEGAKMPLQNIMFSTPFVTSDPVLAVDILNEMNDTIPAFAAEWTDHNLVFLGATVNDTYDLLTKEPLNGLGDLEGRKILGAPAIAPWMEGTGAVAVGTGLPMIYQQLQTGVGDGTIIIPTGAFPLRLHEVAPYITRVDTGVTTTGGLAANADSWARFPDDVKKVLTELGREYSKGHAEIVGRVHDKAIAMMESQGATVSTMSAEDREAWVAGLPDLGQNWIETVSAKGLDGQAFMTRFIEEARERGAEPMRDWSK